ncbi:lipopolysaccharide biosynthesis protein [Grimontia hollisae]|uniref:lipopolysaccharide biosynthesis protein n=1 Tax=Grimontia hollisae TaxID=673 RepID=UPI00165E9A50|nr:hypothetical protein [Grimontia hollisae]
MDRKSRLLINSSVMYLRMILIMLLNFYISRLAINYLGPDLYGLVNVITGFVILISFFTTVLESTAQRYISQSLVLNGDTQTTISTFLFINILGAILISFFAYAIGYYYIEHHLIQTALNNNIVHKVFIYALLTFIINLISSPFMSIFIAYEKVGYYAIFTFLEVMFKFVFLFYIPFDVDERVLYYSKVLFMSVIVSRGLAYVCALHIFKRISLVPKLNIIKAKEIFSFTSWNLVGSLAAISNNQGTNLIINMFFVLSVSASRAIALQLNSAITQVMNSVQMAINPQVFKSYASKNYTYLNYITILNGRVICFLISLICVALVGNIDDLLRFWLGNYPDYLEDFVMLMLVDTYIISQTSALVTLVQASGRIKTYQLVVGGTMLMNLPLSYFLISELDEPLIFYMVSIFISFICLVQRLVFVGRLKVISIRSYFKKVIMDGIIIMVILIGAKMLYKHIFSNSYFLLDIILSLLSCILIYYINLSKQEKTAINTLFRRRAL